MNGGFVSNAVCDNCTTVIPAEAGLKEKLEPVSYTHLKHFPDYFLQRADCPDHTPAGYQPGAGSYRWRPRKKVHVYVLCYLSLCI